MTTLTPRDAKDVETAVRDAIGAGQPLEIIGHGTKRAIGHRSQTNALLDISALSGVTSYEPNELILTVQAGASLHEVDQLIAGKNQEFAFEPMDTAALLGMPAQRGTIGGMLAAGLAGPRRVKAGGARDHLLGVAAVSGFGESFKAGGKVVKNVTGYDLCKLVAGSWGTLSVMTEVTLKVMPRAESGRTLVLRGLDATTAGQAMGTALGSPFDVSGAAYVPVSSWRGRSALTELAAGEALTLIRLEGIAASVAHRARALAAALKALAAADEIEGEMSQRVWRAIRDVEPFAAAGPLGAWPVWRIVCPPAAGPAFGHRLARETGGDLIYDWGGGLVWAALPPSQDAHAATVRERVSAIGGHATLIRALRSHARDNRRVSSIGSRPCRADRARQSVVRSVRYPQSRPADAGGRMKTEFTLEQLADPDIREADKILRACVHCGFCTATCPTYVLLGDELDSPRGRIYLIKEMLEKNQRPTAEVVKHVDRCLSCLACMTTCPSGVNYMHLVDQARVRIEKEYTRPLSERLLRWTLALVLPRPQLFRISLKLARLGRVFSALLPVSAAASGQPSFFRRIKAMLALAPARLPPAGARGGTVFAPPGERRGRVALLQGCAQQVLSPSINEAAVRLLTRHGVEVVLVAGEQCCGALTHHMGNDRDALGRARANIDAWIAEADRSGLDAILITTSGCGTVVKDYGYLLREDAAYAAKAQRVSTLAKDISEYVAELDLSFPDTRSDLVVAYHAACSLQHGQKILRAPKELLFKSGFVVKDVPEGHLCCGSAGTYNILQPDIAERLRERKVSNIASLKPDVIAAGNIGCMVQIAGATDDEGHPLPVVHTIELVDWATGGPKPNIERALKTN